MDSEELEDSEAESEEGYDFTESDAEDSDEEAMQADKRQRRNHTPNLNHVDV